MSSVVILHWASRALAQKKKRPRDRDHNDVDKALIRALQTPQPHQPDEDEAFFWSLLPSVRTMTQDDKLQFRVDVLQLIQRCKNKRRYTESVTSPSNYSPGSSTFPIFSPQSSHSSDTTAQVHYTQSYTYLE